MDEPSFEPKWLTKKQVASYLQCSEASGDTDAGRPHRQASVPWQIVSPLETR